MGFLFQVWEVQRQLKRRMFNSFRWIMINRSAQKYLGFIALLEQIYPLEYRTIDRLRATHENEQSRQIENPFTKHIKVHQRFGLISILRQITQMYFIKTCYKNSQDNKGNEQN